MRNFDGILFDIDGTLTSTNELIFNSFNYVTEKYINRIFSPEELVEFFGPTEEVILKELTGENYENARKDYFDYYNSHHIKLAGLYPGIKEILKMIKTSNIPLGVFTGKGREAATITLKLLHIYDYFDLIITGDDVVNHKPDPEGILKFVDEFHLEKERILLIGDAPADIKAAHSAGIKIASVVWDSYAKDEVLEGDSDFIFTTVEELKEFVILNI
ncbi:MAG: HAD-IA family hydrolase [Ignavibacteriales bacterium]|nr:HAD-IA family hydrolase [Ignavibacteriales bacterium]